MIIASITMIAAAIGVALIDSFKSEWYIELPLIFSLGIVGAVILSYSLKRMTKRGGRTG
jgi:Na+/proline symporter